MPDLGAWLDETRELPCGELLACFARQVQGLGGDVAADIGAFGTRFRVGDEVLCELSVFGELFIARVGPLQAIEYRVRDEDVALHALDQVVLAYARLRSARTPRYD